MVDKYKLTADYDIYAAGHVSVKVQFFNRIKILNETVKALEKKRKK